MRGTPPHTLRIMSIIPEIPLPDLLAVVFGRLIHPSLRSMRVGVPIGTRGSPCPEEVLALVGALVARGVLHVAYFVGEFVGPFLGFGGEVGIPLEWGEGFGFAALVLDVEALLLVGGEGHFCGWVVVVWEGVVGVEGVRMEDDGLRGW
jgi:hypothetical protein